MSSLVLNDSEVVKSEVESSVNGVSVKVKASVKW